MLFNIYFHRGDFFLACLWRSISSPGCAAVRELCGQGINPDVGASSSLGCMNLNASLAWESQADGFRAVHQLLLPSHNEVSLYYGFVISLWLQKLSPPKWVWSAGCLSCSPAWTEQSWQPRRRTPLKSSSLAFYLKQTAGVDCWAEPVPQGMSSWRLHNTMCNACPEYFLPAPLESIPPGKVAFATSGASPALLDKGKRWGGVKPAWLHAGWTSLTFCCAFSLLTWIISMHSSLKWGKFNRSAYFLVFLPLSSANLPILMSFISWETITSLSPGLKFREGLGMFYQTLLVFNRSLWKS